MNTSARKKPLLDNYLTPRDIAGPLRLPVARVRELLGLNPDIAYLRLGRTIRIPAEGVAELLARYREGGQDVAPKDAPTVAGPRRDARAELRRHRRAETKSLRRITNAAMDLMNWGTRKR